MSQYLTSAPKSSLDETGFVRPLVDGDIYEINPGYRVVCFAQDHLRRSRFRLFRLGVNGAEGKVSEIGAQHESWRETSESRFH